jgi:2-polyprenyl-6-methoxyphenol hydroxylase-like FAD-dependent oxidoreductase
VTPFGGEGVNLAFQDALKLSNAIIDTRKETEEFSLDARILAFEEDMFARGHKAQVLTEGMKQDMLFTKGAPRSSIGRWLLRKVDYGLPNSIEPVVYPLIAAAIHSFFFFYKLFV